MPLTTRQSAPASADDQIRLPALFPRVPEDVRARFNTSVPQWNDEIDRWWRVVVNSVNDFGRSNADATNDVIAQTGDIVLRQDGFTVALTEERTARITADEAIARWVVTVSAIASSSQNISVQNTAPGSPSLNDLWVDNTDITNPITRYWNGAAWVEQTDFVLAAAVAEERSARVTADGFLEGKYTITVSAGGNVTGMNITSASGPGVNISSVTFVASDFKIFNGVTGVTTFDISGTTVRLGGTLVVNTTGNKVYIGTGSYGNTNTSWYVDSAGFFSLKDKLTWDPTTSTLTITGSLTATTGTIGGWTIGASTISANNAVLDSAGQLVLGTSNDVIILSATNATYRVWAGNASAASASFSVTKAGLLFANDATIAGTFVASDNAAFPTWQGGTLATRGMFNQRSGGTAPAYASLGFSTSSLIEGNIAAGSYGALTAVTTTNVGLLLNTKYYNGSSWVSGPNIELRNDASVSGTAAASGYIQFLLTNTSTNSGIWKWGSDGVLTIGASIFTMDTNLYRSAANTLRTDDAFIAASFSGVGTALTALNASNLGSGTIPDARFPATLPAASGANLTSLNASNISSGTLGRPISTSNFDTSGSSVDVDDQNLRVNVSGSPVLVLNKDLPGLTINGSQIVGTRKTGWSAATGTATRTSFDTATVTTEQLAQRVKAWIDDALSHGLVGA